jgi:hypothetical protein
MMSRSTRGTSRLTRTPCGERRLTPQRDAFRFRISGEICEADVVDYTEEEWNTCSFSGPVVGL